MGFKARPAGPKWDEALAERIRVALGPRADVIEQRMFGGLCFLVGGHMTAGLKDQYLMVRVGRDDYDSALKHRDGLATIGAFRPMRTIVWIDPRGTSTQSDVKRWVERGLRFTKTLPKR